MATAASAARRGTTNHPTAIRLTDDRTWPADVRAYLADEAEHLDASASRFEAIFTPRAVDEQRAVIEQARELLPTEEHGAALLPIQRMLEQHTILGWHPARLTDAEMAVIRHVGMHRDRMLQQYYRDTFQRYGGITRALANQLRTWPWFSLVEPRNYAPRRVARVFDFGASAEAQKRMRAGRPSSNPVVISGQGSHGRPTVITAVVPIRDLGEWELMTLCAHVVRRYLRRVEQSALVIGCVPSVPAARISEVARFPSREFSEITSSDTWPPKLRARLGESARLHR